METAIDEQHIREAIKHHWAEKYGGKFDGWELTTKELNVAVGWIMIQYDVDKPLKESISDACADLWDSRMETMLGFAMDNLPLPGCEMRDEGH